MVRADWLFLLTDVPCLYTANPSVDPSAEPIHEVRDIAALQVTLEASRLRLDASMLNAQSTLRISEVYEIAQIGWCSNRMQLQTRLQLDLPDVFLETSIAMQKGADI